MDVLIRFWDQKVKGQGHTADDGPENRVNATIVTIDDDDDDDDEIAYFTVR